MIDDTNRKSYYRSLFIIKYRYSKSTLIYNPNDAIIRLLSAIFCVCASGSNEVALENKLDFQIMISGQARGKPAYCRKSMTDNAARIFNLDV